MGQADCITLWEPTSTSHPFTAFFITAARRRSSSTYPKALRGFYKVRKPTAQWHEVALTYCPARTTVHFATVVDKFSPHDAIISATSPQDLTSAAISNALGLAAEAADEPVSPDKMAATVQGASGQVGPLASEQQTDELTNNKTRANSARIDEHPEKPMVPRPSAATRKNTAMSELQKELDELHDGVPGIDSKPQQVNTKSNDVMGLKAFLSNVSPPHESSVPKLTRKQAPATSHGTASQRSNSRYSESNDLPKTSYSTRTSTTDIWRSWKPKLKLGPRPVESAKAQSPAADRQKLPAGIKIRMPKAVQEDTPKDKNLEVPRTSGARSVAEKRPSKSMSSRPDARPREQLQSAQDVKGTPAPPAPAISSEAKVSNTETRDDSKSRAASESRPEVSQSSKVKPPSTGFGECRDSLRPAGLGINAVQTSAPVSPAIRSASALTPEKQRLMRALQIRRKQNNGANIDSSPVDTASPMPSIDSRGFTPDPDTAVKSDSGVDMQTPDLETQPTVTPVTSQTASTVSHLSPLQSHPISSNDGPDPSGSRRRKSPSPSADYNKELPKLPGEVIRMEASLTENPAAVSSRTSSLKRKRSVTDDIHNEGEQDDQHSLALASEGTEFYNELEAARVEEAKPLAVPPQLHTRDTSISSPTITSVTIKTALSHQPSPGVRSDGLPSPGLPQFTAPAAAPPERHPSNSSRPASSRPTQKSRRTNMSSGISRRIQALAKLSHEDDQTSRTQAQTAYESAQAFLAPGTLPGQQGNASSSTAVGRAYEASRSRSPSKHSIGTSKTLRPQTSFDRGSLRVSNSDASTSKGPTGYRKRDSLTVTAHIMRGHDRDMQRMHNTSIVEEPGDTQSAYDALMGDRAVTEPDPRTKAISPLPDGQLANLTFSHQSTDRSEEIKRPASRSSARSGRARGSLDGWRSAFSTMTTSRRDSSSSSGRQRPFTSRSSTYDHSLGRKEQPRVGGLVAVEEVSEGDTLAARASRMLKRMSQMNGGSNINQRKGKPERPSPSKDAIPERGVDSPQAPQSQAVTGRMSDNKRVAVGDLNIQFPDTLLWKRRWVEIDSVGNLVLSPPSSTPGARTGNGASRKYHLTEFKQPVVPSRDRQEMPHSVVRARHFTHY